MEAIPRGLVSREMMKMIPGIKCVRTNILPANSSGNYSFSASSNNRITFQIPSFPNSYIFGKRSFIRFLLKTSSNGVLIPQANSLQIPFAILNFPFCLFFRSHFARAHMAWGARVALRRPSRNRLKIGVRREGTVSNQLLETRRLTCTGG